MRKTTGAKRVGTAALWAAAALLALNLGTAGCWRPPGFGVGGKYNDAIDELRKSRKGGNSRKAIADLQYVVRRDPRYRDSLTQLGRAYYYAGRYRAASDVLTRALVLDREDEIGWLVMGLTQLRQGDDEEGLKSYKGGLSLLAKATQDGYRDFTPEFWDTRGVVRRSLRRNISLARKGVSEKRRLIVAGEDLLHRIDKELYDAEAYKDQSEYLDNKRDRR